jgi:threonine/homoserine/homoserine lactone efflux protein
VYTLFFNPVLQKEMWQKFLEGSAGSIPLTQGFVLITAVLMETVIAMVVLSRVLKHRANRWVNIASGAFHTLFVLWSLFGDTVSIYYLFFAILEMACTLFIVWLAIRWKPADPRRIQERMQRRELPALFPAPSAALQLRAVIEDDNTEYAAMRRGARASLRDVSLRYWRYLRAGCRIVFDGSSKRGRTLRRNGCHSQCH